MTTILDSPRPLFRLFVTVAIFLGATQRAYTDYLEEVFADSPIGYWRFEERDGPAVDWTGNARDGIYMNGVTPGLFPGASSIGGKSAAFDGTTGFVDLPGSWGGESMSELTLEAWVNPSEPITGNFQAIVAGHDPNAFAHFQLHSAGNTGVYTNTGFVAAPIVPATPTGEWRHVVMTAKSGETKVYVDGAQVGGTVTTPFEFITESSNVDIGIGHVETRWFNGLLDEVAIYDTALSEERILAHLFAGGGELPEPPEPPPPATLISHWTFDSDSDASDTVGGHDGSFEGGASLTGDAHVGDGALDLRGVDGYVDVPTAALDGEESFSVAMFVSVDTLTHACCSALFTNDSWSSGKLHVNVGTSTGVPEAAINGNPAGAWGRDVAIPTDGSWVHLAFTYDGKSGTMTPYVDGWAGNPGAGGTITSVGDGPLNIGAWDTSGEETQDRFLDGRIDDLRLYSGVLTPEEVDRLIVSPDCDFDDDGACDVDDLDQLMYTGLGTEDAIYDLNSSGGAIDLADRDEWLNAAGNETIGLPYVLGDASLDGRVDAEDLNELGISWQRTDATSWEQGDFDGNGRVDASDLNEIGVNWQHGVAAAQAAAVPEPGCVGLVFIGWVVSCLSCRRLIRRS